MPDKTRDPENRIPPDLWSQIPSGVSEIEVRLTTGESIDRVLVDINGIIVGRLRAGLAGLHGDSEKNFDIVGDHIVAIRPMLVPWYKFGRNPWLHRPISAYEWEPLRHWCIAFLHAFLRNQETLDTKEGWVAYRIALEALPQIEWRKLRRLPDERIRYVVDVIISSVEEGADKKTALPGMFKDTVKGAQEFLRILECSPHIDKAVVDSIRQVDDAI